MRCSDVTRELSAPTGSIPGSALAEHLNGCARCASRAAEARRFDALWEETRLDDPTPEASARAWGVFEARLAEFEAKAKAKAKAAPRAIPILGGGFGGGFRARWSPVAALALLAVGLAWLVRGGGAPLPFDRDPNRNGVADPAPALADRDRDRDRDRGGSDGSGFDFESNRIPVRVANLDVAPGRIGFIRLTDSGDGQPSVARLELARADDPTRGEAAADDLDAAPAGADPAAPGGGDVDEGGDDAGDFPEIDLNDMFTLAAIDLPILNHMEGIADQ